ncbi:MAG: PAS domain S-box protein [Flavobacteriaceae bacterium]|nr:PAS domain S-box protein [Flavobacteriaceae bacterium]
MQTQMQKNEIEDLKSALLKAELARKKAEQILGDKNFELQKINQKLASTNKMMEALLDDQSTQLNAIVNNSSLGIVLTEKGNLIKANNAFKKILGYTEIELKKLTIKDITHKDDLFNSLKYIKKLENGTINDFLMKKRYRRKDGNYIICKTNVTAIRDTKGKLKYQVALIEDVTVSEQHVNMLKAINLLSVSILGKNDLFDISWEIAKNTANHLGLEDCVIYTVDTKKKMMTQVAAYGEKNSEGYTIKNILTIPIGKGIVGTVALTGKAELINDTTLDERYIVDCNVRCSELAVPIIVNNKVIGVIDSEHSEKNYFNKEHLDTFTNIANLAAAQFNNAISLLKEEASKTEKNKLLTKLEKSNIELNNFAQVVSHDLKSPLRSMSALISWIHEDNHYLFNDETNDNFEKLLKKVDKMDHLINGILKYSSIDKTNFTSQDVDLHELVTDMIDLIYIPNHFSIKIKTKLPTFKSNKFKLQQLFQNLISNAIKYNNNKKAEVIIDCVEKPKSYLFSIKDNGIGIDPKYHKKIFEVFETLEEPDENSTGIGLSIVKKIITLFDGKIWLESKFGAGTTFFFELKKETPKV